MAIARKARISWFLGVNVAIGYFQACLYDVLQGRHHASLRGIDGCAALALKPRSTASTHSLRRARASLRLQKRESKPC